MRSDTRSDPAVTKPNEALRFIHKSELCWTLQSAHVILEEDLSDWKTGNSRQLKRSVRNESDWVGGAPQYRARDALWVGHDRRAARNGKLEKVKGTQAFTPESPWLRGSDLN